jgi:hypothetical protein
VLAECRCQHRGVVDSSRMARFYFLHRYPTSLDTLHQHLRCSRCGQEAVRVAPCWEKASFPAWGADEDRWKRLQRRLRG